MQEGRAAPPMTDDKNWFFHPHVLDLVIELPPFNHPQWGQGCDHEGDIHGLWDKLPVDPEPVFQKNLHPVGKRGATEWLFIERQVELVVEGCLHSYKVILLRFI